MGSGSVHLQVPDRRARRVAMLPTTRLGWWAVRLAAAYVVLGLAWSVMGPLGALPSFACGLAGGVVALVAIFRRRERAVTVFAALVPLVFVVLFVLAELIVGHD